MSAKIIQIPRRSLEDHLKNDGRFQNRARIMKYVVISVFFDP